MTALEDALARGEPGLRDLVAGATPAGVLRRPPAPAAIPDPSAAEVAMIEARKAEARAAQQLEAAAGVAADQERFRAEVTARTARRGGLPPVPVPAPTPPPAVDPRPPRSDLGQCPTCNRAYGKTRRCYVCSPTRPPGSAAVPVVVPKPAPAGERSENSAQTYSELTAPSALGRELAALGAVAAALDGLDEAAAGRVLSWAMSRFAAGSDA